MLKHGFKGLTWHCLHFKGSLCLSLDEIKLSVLQLTVNWNGLGCAGLCWGRVSCALTTAGSRTSLGGEVWWGSANGSTATLLSPVLPQLLVGLLQPWDSCYCSQHWLRTHFPKIENCPPSHHVLLWGGYRALDILFFFFKYQKSVVHQWTRIPAWKGSVRKQWYFTDVPV